jgi:hypothetical protein
MSSGHQLLSTRYGPLDLWGEIGAGRGFSELVKESTTISIGRGFRVRVLGLEALIRIKAETARDEDRAMLAILRRTFEESQKAKRPPEDRDSRTHTGARETRLAALFLLYNRSVPLALAENVRWAARLSEKMLPGTA